MKTTDKTSTNEAAHLAPIEAADLDGVTGGCAACGQNCAAGPAPADSVARPQNLFGTTVPA